MVQMCAAPMLPLQGLGSIPVSALLWVSTNIAFSFPQLHSVFRIVQQMLSLTLAKVPNQGLICAPPLILPLGFKCFTFKNSLDILPKVTGKHLQSGFPVNKICKAHINYPKNIITHQVIFAFDSTALLIQVT